MHANTLESNRALIATLRRVTTDPDLSKTIAALLSLDSPIEESNPISVDCGEPARLPIIAPRALGVAREGVSRSVRTRDGPVVR